MQCPIFRRKNLLDIKQKPTTQKKERKKLSTRDKLLNTGITKYLTPMQKEHKLIFGEHIKARIKKLQLEKMLRCFQKKIIKIYMAI